MSDKLSDRILFAVQNESRKGRRGVPRYIVTEFAADAAALEAELAEMTRQRDVTIKQYEEMVRAL